MPVLDRLTADTILSRKQTSDYLANYRLRVQEQRSSFGPDLLQPLDERVLGHLLFHHAKGRHFTTVLSMAKALQKKQSSVCNSLRRLRRYHLLPFEVRS